MRWCLHVPRLLPLMLAGFRRCLLLARSPTAPFPIPSSNCRCTFVQFNRHCKADEHLIAYLPLFYCRTGDGRALVALFFLAWAGVLFWLMASVAEDFLVPALEVRCAVVPLWGGPALLVGVSGGQG